MDVLLTTRQLQDLLQVDRITIYRMLNDGRLQGFKVGGQWRFSRQAVELWLQERQAGMEPPSASQAPRRVDPSGEDLSIPCLQPIQDILADAVGVGAVITALDGRPLTRPSNPTRFCQLLQDSAVRPLCFEWRQTTAERLGAKAQVLTCHAGLRCACTRIEVQGNPIAALFVGPWLDYRVEPESDEWPGPIAGLAAAMEAPPAVAQDGQRTALHTAWLSVPALDEAQRQKLMQLLPRVVAAFAEIGEERARLMNRLRRIAEISNL